eukprot:1519527-Prymnesium_polylepis.2
MLVGRFPFNGGTRQVRAESAGPRGTRNTRRHMSARACTRRRIRPVTSSSTVPAAHATRIVPLDRRPSLRSSRRRSSPQPSCAESSRRRPCRASPRRSSDGCSCSSPTSATRSRTSATTRGWPDCPARARFRLSTRARARLSRARSARCLGSASVQSTSSARWGSTGTTTSTRPTCCCSRSDDGRTRTAAAGVAAP